MGINFSKNTIKKLGKYNKGAYFNRTKINNKTGKRERAFAIAWRKTNKRIGFLNHGYGTLENLFISHEKWFVKYNIIIKSRDRFIAATIIQWLGTNVGFCWLQEVLKTLGYKIERIEIKK